MFFWSVKYSINILPSLKRSFYSRNDGREKIFLENDIFDKKWHLYQAISDENRLEGSNKIKKLDEDYLWEFLAYNMRTYPRYSGKNLWLLRARFSIEKRNKITRIKEDYLKSSIKIENIRGKDIFIISQLVSLLMII